MITFHQVGKKFGDTPVLNDVSFNVSPGTITALVGHNGAGKTTTLRIMLGLTDFNGGRVEVKSLNPKVDSLKIRRFTSYVPDSPFISSHLTGYEHLQFHADVYKQPQALELAKRLIGDFELGTAIQQSAGTYSRGMAQKLALVRAFMVATPILLLDEPFNALDPLGVELVKSILRERAGQGGTILVSSHLLPMLDGFVEQIIVLKKGRLVYIGSCVAIDWSSRMGEWFDRTEDDVATTTT